MAVKPFARLLCRVMTTSDRPSIIAIDGPAASGKTTVGKVLAQRLAYRFLDTGLMYRAFTLAALRAGIAAVDSDAATLAETIDMRLSVGRVARISLDDEDVTDDLHRDDIEQRVSAYSRIAAVRTAMRTRQRDYAAAGRAILAGRDIGEVVLPDADLKFYLEASEEAREARRHSERTGDRHEVGQALRTRDRGDAAQTFRPGDAVTIDTTHLTLDEVVALAWEAIECFSA